MFIREIMTRNPITIRPQSDYLAAIALMRAGKLRRLPVIDDDQRVVGMVSLDKLKMKKPEEAARTRAVQSDGILMRVRDVMSTPVISVSPDYPMEEAARLMVEKRISSLPVVEDEKLVGIVTDSDIFRLFVRVLGGGSRTIRLSVELGNTPGQLSDLTGLVASVGGNILSIASHPAETAETMNFTLRVEHATLDELLAAVKSYPGAKIRSIWDQTQEEE
jgi:acetoin utilization protein AcuB